MFKQNYQKNNQQDGIVLLHGIMRTKWSMAILAWVFERKNYQVLNINYPSRKFPLEKLAEIIHPQIIEFSQTFSGKIHFVGHSMGGLLIRAYINKYHPKNLGRVLMMGTPNQGSQIADFVKNWWLFKKLYGPAGSQLITNQNDFREIFGEVNYELGIIAGNRSLDLIGSKIIGQESDGKVAVENTKIAGMKDFITIKVDHTLMPHNRKVIKNAVAFIENGSFDKC